MTFLFNFLGWIQLINFRGEFVFVSVCRHPRWMTRPNWLAHDTPFNHTSFTVHITQTAALSRRGPARCSPLLSQSTRNSTTLQLCFVFVFVRAGPHALASTRQPQEVLKQKRWGTWQPNINLSQSRARGGRCVGWQEKNPSHPDA